MGLDEEAAHDREGPRVMPVDPWAVRVALRQSEKRAHGPRRVIAGTACNLLADTSAALWIMYCRLLSGSH